MVHGLRSGPYTTDRANNGNLHYRPNPLTLKAGAAAGCRTCPDAVLYQNWPRMPIWALRLPSGAISLRNDT
jgi:hypothetical protein